MKTPALWFLASVAFVSFGGCSKSVGYAGKSDHLSIHEPGEVPSPSPTTSPSPTGSPGPSPSPSPTIPVGECGGNPFRELGDYSIFSRGQLVLEGVTAEGRIAGLLPSSVIRGDIGRALPPDGARIDLGVRDQLQVTKTAVPHGRVRASKKLTAIHLDAPFGHGVAPLDELLTDEARLKSAHQFLFALESKGRSELTCARGQSCALVLSGTAATTNVIDVTRSDVASAESIRVDVPAGSTAVIRIRGGKGSSLTWKGDALDLGGVAPERLVWAVIGTETLVAHRRELPGIWVAPGMKIHANDARFEGSVLSSCVFAYGSTFALKSFSGCLPEASAGR